MSTVAYRYAQAMAVTERARGRAEEERAWLDLLILLDATAPAPSAVPEAAVEAAASAVRKERAFSAAAAFGVPIDDVPYCAEMIARSALTAALQLLTAAPSAIRDEVARALEGEFGCFLARDPHRPDAFWGGAADALLARYNMTPKEDR